MQGTLQIIRMIGRFSIYTFVLISVLTNSLFAAKGLSQAVKSVKEAKMNVTIQDQILTDALRIIEAHSDYHFVYKDSDIKLNNKVPISVVAENETIESILLEIAKKARVSFRQVNDRISVRSAEMIDESKQVEIVIYEQINITGIITDETGEALPGASILEKGTTNGTISDVDGKFSLSVPEDAILTISFVGYESKEVSINGRSVLDVSLTTDISALEEVVVIGYGTVEKSDLTGSVAQADLKSFRNQPNISIGQSLQGSVPGLNVGPVNRAGEEPNITVRGKTSISGAQNPLIILDGVIYRGNLIDINPNDIASIDVLKDNSAAAVYGSQAANGVVLITTKNGTNNSGKPSISYSVNYTFQQPLNEMVPLDADEWVQYMLDNDLFNSRTAASGYLDLDPAYSITSNFYDTEQIDNYNSGISTNWGDFLTNDQMYTQMHSLSLTNKTDNLNYLISVGFSDVEGYMVNEGYSRYNARVNADSKINDWLTVGIQSFFASSDYSGEDVAPDARFLPPYIQAYRADGELNYPNSGFQRIWQLEADNLDIRNNLFGNIYAEINFPFLKGLSYKINFANTQITNRDYTFSKHLNNGLGEGGKDHSIQNSMLSDNILSYNRTIYEKHKLGVTLLYGFEKRKYDRTVAFATSFVNPTLGYNSLQSGSSELQQASSEAWEEASLYSMARINYSYDNRYLLTGTIRRDGFSGFSEGNKFGIFPSVALGWVISQESFLSQNDAISFLKLRAGYGSTGNRTIGRYQTLAKVSDGFNYITADETSVYTKYISSLASGNLKWETTTGLNLGVDFELLNSRLSGSIDYYNNNTTNLLYNVDVPSISRFTNFPDNLGKIHNEGLEIILSSINISTNNLTWSTDLVFSRNRDELVQLLGFDNDGDGVEDDLVSEGLFIGEPFDVIYDYETTGQIYQIGDDIPSGSSEGSFVIVDQNGDDIIDQINDYKILGYENPGYRFSIGNTVSYKNWSLFVFINSIQGGKDYYFKLDDQNGNEGGFNDYNSGNRYNRNIAKGFDAWLPENPDSRYERIGAISTERAKLLTQRNFVRLQDISLSYSFGPELLEKLKLQNLRLFVSGKNLLTLTKWPGLDPETGDSYTSRARPVLRSVSLGLNLDF